MLFDERERGYGETPDLDIATTCVFQGGYDNLGCNAVMNYSPSFGCYPSNQSLIELGPFLTQILSPLEVPLPPFPHLVPI